MFNDRINNIIKNYLNGSKYSKLSIGIKVKNKEFILNFDAFGLTTKEEEYNIGSISKTFMAHLIMKYVNLKVLDLNMPASIYLGVNDLNYPTIYQLLTHTAGYNHFTPIKFTIKAIIPNYYSKYNIYENIKNKDVIKEFLKRKRKKQYNYFYSDFSYAILAVVLEKTLNRKIGDILGDFIKKDLNLENTNLLCKHKTNNVSVLNNKVINDWVWYDDNPYIVAGGISSNVSDMLKYINLQLYSKESYIVDCHKVNENTKKRKDKTLICLGWHAYKSSNHLWHVGGVGTFRSSIIVSKKREIGIIVMGNKMGKKNANTHYLAKYLYSYICRNNLIDIGNN